jgi:hypothetical protein
MTSIAQMPDIHARRIDRSLHIGEPFTARRTMRTLSRASSPRILALDRVPSVPISSAPFQVNDEVGRPNPGDTGAAGSRENRASPESGEFPATPFHAVVSRSVRPVIAAGEARARRAPILTEC